MAVFWRRLRGFVVFVWLCVLAEGGGACETAISSADLFADDARLAIFESGKKTQLGGAVNAVGDINGDGFDDFAIAAPFFQVGSGAVYVIFGRSASEWGASQFDFSNADTPDSESWIRISVGLGSNCQSLGARSLAHGDWNGDGTSDLALSSNGCSSAFVIFGHSQKWSSFSTSNVSDGTILGFTITGRTSSSHILVGSGGDINGDGIEDLFCSESDGGGTTLFSSSLVFGEQSVDRSNFLLNDINGANGFTVSDGTPTLGIGGAFGSVGDLNGDGLADLGIGSTSAKTGAGCAYILFARNVSATGQQWAPVDLSLDLDGTIGFAVEGPASSKFGRTVVGAGDVNADGFADVFVGTDHDVGNAGAWIVFGHQEPFPSSFGALQMDGTNGFHFVSSSNEYWGYSGGGAGDVNGDGVDDIVFGGYKALNSSGSLVGAAAIIFGHGGLWPAELDREDAVGSIGFLIFGPSESSYCGASVRGAGDVNNDGIADFVVGAPYYKTQYGLAVLVFGVADDHCAVCSNTSNACLVCDDDFILNGIICEEKSFDSSSSSLPKDPSRIPISSASAVSASSLASSFSSQTVVIVTGGGGTVGELAVEIAQLLGVDVGQISVVEITPGIFEVTVTNEEVAQQLVTLIEQCIKQQEEANEQ